MIGVAGRRIRTPAAVLGLVLLWVAASWAGPVVRIQPEAEVRAPSVTLLEIAEISGVEDEDKLLLEGHYIGFAPQCGHDVTFSRYMLDAKKKELQRSGFEFAAFVIPDGGVTIRTRCVELSGEEILSVAEGFIIQQLPWSADEIEIVRSRIPDAMRFPEGEVEIRPQASRSAALSRAADAKVDIIVNGQVIRSLNLGSHLSFRVPVMAAARPIKHHQVISEDDLTLVHEDIRRIPREPALAAEQVVGMRVTHSVNQGNLLDMNGIEVPPVILRRERVTILLKHSNMEIRMQGIALEDGRPGQTIQVENAESRARLLAVAAAPGLVEIEMRR